MGRPGSPSRGNFEAYTRVASHQKWLEVHGGAHWVDFYTDRGIAIQKQFFDHFLKDEDNRWDKVPSVQLQVRHADGSLHDRVEDEWPLARTVWTRYHLTPDGGMSRDGAEAGTIAYDATGEGVTFRTPPSDEVTEITGPMSARIFISSETTDADLFVIVRLFDPDEAEVTFMGALDPNTPVAQGWLRASHRALDPEKTLPFRPCHSHDQVEPLVPGEVYELEVEIWPTSIVIPRGYVLGLTVRGNDYRYEGELSEFARSFHYANRGIGPFTHTDPDDRPAGVFDRRVTLHLGGETDSYLLAPVISEPGH